MTLSASTLPIQIPSPQKWHSATWDDYMALRDALIREPLKLAFNQGWLWVEMGGEGINHANIRDLFTMLFLCFAMKHPAMLLTSLGGCLLEKPNTQACAPDLVLYVGEDFPRWQEGEPRRIELTKWRVPNLVGEISDTTLASDLDEQKHLYAALGIPEYWVVDVLGQRVFAFQLENGRYEACSHSQTLAGLPISLLEQALARSLESTNTHAAIWFSEQLTSQ